MASVQSTGKAGFKDKLKGNILKEMQAKGHSEDDIEKYYVVKVQNAWRARQSRIFVTALKQESTCKAHRQDNPTIKRGQNGEPDKIQVTACVACGEGEMEATVQQKIARKQYQDVQKLLFWGQQAMTVEDTGDNWNQRFQRAMDLPEGNMEECILKYQTLSAINKDFVSSATRYAKTIISEYFLHVKDKSIRAKNFGGFAGGQKYLWRGILFKMADGSTGPWNGSDEAAAKAAGHDMKSVVHYFEAGVEALRFPLMALIDYRGFRMTAQALLPLGKDSLKYGSSDAGRTVHKDDPEINELIKTAAVSLNIRSHVVGSSVSPVITSAAEINEKTLHAAVDIEGHIGMDGRYYMLDLARSFPPESVAATEHLSDLHEDGTSVLVFIPSCRVRGQEMPSKVLMGTIYKAYIEGKHYDILLETGKVLFRHPAEYIRARRLSIFWRLLRPEYVRDRGNRIEPAAKATSLKGNAGIDLVETVADSLARDAVAQVANYFDVIVPAFAEMSGAVDAALSHDLSPRTAPVSAVPNSTDDNGDAAYDEFAATPSPVPVSEMSPNFADAVYDNFESGDAASNHIATPSACDLGYDEFVAVKVGYQLDSLLKKTDEGQEDVVGSYGAYDDFEQVSTVGSSIQTDILVHPDGTIDAEGPLSPDAGSAFSRADPYAAARNEEVRLATVKLLEVVIPAAATELCELPLSAIHELDLAVFLHTRGINMRHLGILRSCIPATKENFVPRLKILVEIISRTLKNLLRDFQRRWMRSEKSTSEEGMLNLITQFLNLVVGYNLNSEEFWAERVVIGMIQRFGSCIWYFKESSESPRISLTSDAILAEVEKLRKSALFLQTLIPRFYSMMGLVLNPITLNSFMADPNPYKFEFMPSDIAEYEPKVKCMHIVNFGIGAALQFDAENRHLKPVEGDKRIIHRMLVYSKKHYEQAQISLPADSETRSRLQAVRDMMLTHKSGDPLRIENIRSANLIVPPMKQGTLKKDGNGFFSSWTTRHFVLLGGKLTYFEKAMESAPYGVNEKGRTDLADMKVSQVPYVAQYRMKLEHSIDAKERAYLIEAVSQGELDEWMCAINDHIKYATK